MSEVEWAVLGYDKKDKSEFIDRTPESREEAESQIARFYSRPSQYRDVRVVSRTVGEWGTPSSGVTEGKAESGDEPVTAGLLRGMAADLDRAAFATRSAGMQAIKVVAADLRSLADLVPNPQPSAPADDAASVLAGLVKQWRKRADEYGDHTWSRGLMQQVTRECADELEAVQQRLADRGQRGGSDG